MDEFALSGGWFLNGCALVSLVADCSGQDFSLPFFFLIFCLPFVLSSLHRPLIVSSFSSQPPSLSLLLLFVCLYFVSFVPALLSCYPFTLSLHFSLSSFQLSPLHSSFNFSLPSYLFLNIIPPSLLYIYLSSPLITLKSLSLFPLSPLVSAFLSPPLAFSPSFFIHIALSLSLCLPASSSGLPLFCACCFSILCRELSCDANYID